MIRLEELLYSLTTVIVRYHDSLVAKRLVLASNKAEMQLKSRLFATQIITDNEQDFRQRLGGIIQTCTEGYPGRRPFLNFLLNEITLLHSFLSRKESFSSAEFNTYKEQTFKLLMDFKGLLTTTKSKTYPVTQHKTGSNSEAIIALSGCINDGYTGNEFCNSGIFLIEEVLDTLNIKINFVEDKFKEFAERICTEHQNALLVPELTHMLQESEREKIESIDSVRKSQQVIIDDQSKQVEELQAQIQQKLASALPDQSIEIRRLEEQLERQKQLATRQNDKIKDLEGTQQTQQATIDMQLKQIGDLTAQKQQEQSHASEQSAEIRRLEALTEQQKQQEQSHVSEQSAEISRLEALIEQQKQLANEQEEKIRALTQQVAMAPQARVFGFGGYSPGLFPFINRFPRTITSEEVIATPEDSEVQGTSNGLRFLSTE